MKTIAVIFGGRSTEHDVSVITAIASVIKPLELIKEYKVEPIYISREGKWYWDAKLKDIALYTTGEIDDFIRRSHPVSIQFDGGMTLVKSSGIAGRKQLKKIDVVFPAMHGTYGEDGSLMGLLEMAGVPYVGCGVAASAIAMDKLRAKEIAVANRILTPKYLAYTKRQLERDPSPVVREIEGQLRFPLFVKPAHLGSSIGISRVSDQDELRNGLEVAAHYDTSIIVEEAVQNLIEVTLPIIGNETPRPALLESPNTKPEDFFDFDTKYMQGGKKGGKSGGIKGSSPYSQIPAALTKKIYAHAESLGLQMYKALGCTGTARVDMLIDSKSEEVFFNEVNPLPGGLYAHNWKTAGISSIELVHQLIQLAEERFSDKEKLTTSFSTNYLQQF